MKKNATAKAFVMSVLALVLCLSMLVGTTFAWFTDSVTSGVNKIVAGNLDVELEYAKEFNDDGTVKTWAPVTADVKLFSDKEKDGTTDNLWEPGHTEVVYLKISNEGTLSLNYKLAVTVAHEHQGTRYNKETNSSEFFKLSDYLKFGAVTDWDGRTVYLDRTDAQKAIGEAGKLKNYSTTGSIKASEKETNIQYIALVVYMPEEIGNEANHRSGSDAYIPWIELGINLEATQMVDENDSFGNDYDKDAFQNNEQTPVEEDAFADLDKQTFHVKTEADLYKLQDLVFQGNTFEGKVITLADNVTLGREWIPIGTETTPFKGTFDGDNHTISGLKITEFTSNVDSPNSTGLFGVVERATIKNVAVEGAITIHEDVVVGNIGGICGKDKNGSTFDACTNRVEISVIGPNITCVGGILGLANGWGDQVKILNSTNDANITVDTQAEDSYVGGITSVSIGSSPIMITNCTHSADKVVSGGTVANDICNGTYKS